MSFPEVIDNTIRKSFVLCPMQARRRYVENLRPIGSESVDLLFGGAFAVGVERTRKEYYEGNCIAAEATQLGIGAAMQKYGNFVPTGRTCKTRERLVGALRYYFEQWPLGDDGLTPMQDGIECSFSFDLPIRHPDTGKQLQYAGRFDMKALDSQGRIVIVDEKTTSKLGDSWAEQWDLDTQMTGYIYSVAREQDTREVMAQIRGISILPKGDYGHVEVPIVRSDWMLVRWYKQLLRDVGRMKDAYVTGMWDAALHANACGAYNRPCDYKMLCLTPNPERLIEGNYEEMVWNPLGSKK